MTRDGHARGMALIGSIQEPITAGWLAPSIAIDKPPADESNHKKDLMARDVNMTASQTRTAPAYLKWSEAVITFHKTDHTNHIQWQGGSLSSLGQ